MAAASTSIGGNGRPACGTPALALLLPKSFRPQDDTHVVLVVRTPHVKADELDLEVSRSVFKMYIRPYFLSLTFKQPLAEDGKETANWDVGKGYASPSRLSPFLVPRTCAFMSLTRHTAAGK